REYQDAQTYARWNVDSLKYDWCNCDDLRPEGAYATMRDARRAAGRPIVFSICEWGNSKPWEWGGKIGNLWRTTGDIHACFDCKVDHGTWFSWGVMQILDLQNGLRRYAGPGHWNDPDMLEVGNGMSLPEDRAHFSMWAMLAAPLISGNDIGHMSSETAAILTNRGVIAVDQDSLGIEGFRYAVADSLEVWLKPLSHDAWAMVFLNRARSPRSASFDFRKEAVADSVSGRQARFGEVTYHIRDLWANADRGTTAQPLNVTVPSHDVIAIRLSR